MLGQPLGLRVGQRLKRVQHKVWGFDSLDSLDSLDQSCSEIVFWIVLWRHTHVCLHHRGPRQKVVLFLVVLLQKIAELPICQIGTGHSVSLALDTDQRTNNGFRHIGALSELSALSALLNALLNDTNMKHDFVLE